ncbi:MAG: hypothetical protein R6V60_11570 [Desulfobacterales bacterium]
MSLKSWLANGWLVAHRSSRQEITELFALVDRDLKDCQTEGLSGDWRFNIAYNAALQAATAALAAAGYRPAREAHHFRVIQSLAHTIGIDPDMIIQFDQFRKKRNVGGYERSGSISDHEVAEMIRLARELREKSQEWIRSNAAHLVSDEGH